MKVSIYSAYYIIFVDLEYEEEILELYYKKRIYFKEFYDSKEVEDPGSTSQVIRTHKKSPLHYLRE